MTATYREPTPFDPIGPADLRSRRYLRFMFAVSAPDAYAGPGEMGSRNAQSVPRSVALSIRRYGSVGAST